MKITYYHSAFGKDITRNVFGEITFEKDEYNNVYVKFASGGNHYSVSIDNVKKIED